MEQLQINLFRAAADLAPFASLSVPINWQEARALEAAVGSALKQAQETRAARVDIKYDHDLIILYNVGLNNTLATYSRYSRIHMCVTCGQRCVGMQCRACYTDPKYKKQPESIWRHDWAYVYELADPDTGQVRYVGCSEHPQIRLRLHECNAWREKSKKDLWLRDLARRSKHPHLTIVRKVPYSQRLEEEQRHIWSLLDAGTDLLNVVVRQRPTLDQGQGTG